MKDSRSHALAAGVVALTVIGMTLPSRPAGATTLDFANFADLSSFQLNGNAGPLDPSTLRLSSDVMNQSGSAFLLTPVVFAAGDSFHTAFSFRIGPNPAGADGITFTIESSSAGSTALGTVGGGIGYGGIPSSMAIEFDTYKNAWDPNSNHVALMLGGDQTTHVAYATPPFPMANGAVDYAWIDYDGAANVIAVYLTQSPTKPTGPLLSYRLDLVEAIGALPAFVGFTSGTGHDMNNHDLLTWQFSSDAVACTDAACGECVSDYDPSSTASDGCPISELPVCARAPDPHAGTCVQCTSSNGLACSGATPVCIGGADVCGCVSDADCNGDMCDHAVAASGVCETKESGSSAASGIVSGSGGGEATRGAGAGSGSGTEGAGGSAVGGGGSGGNQASPAFDSSCACGIARLDDSSPAPWCVSAAIVLLARKRRSAALGQPS